LVGRNFDASSKSENNAVILNEAAAQLLGYKNPAEIVDQPLHNLTDKESKIVGVIKNYHQRSLKNGYEPIVFVPSWVEAHRRGWNKNYYFVRLNATNNLSDIQRSVTEMETAWKASSPEHPFQYFFLDSYFDSHYKSETTFGFLFLFFSGFAIFISCLGLFGWVAYATLQRTKEIGIRKVLGASVKNILMLLSKEFVKLVLIAAFLTIPLAILGLQNWLEVYAFRIQLTAWLFVLPLVLIFFLALLTVVLKSLKVATSNPIDSIRYE
jgi:putative ABC transport system permease protein